MRKNIFTPFLFLLSILFLTSCAKNDSQPTYSTIAIHYINNAGNDLFTNGQNGYIRGDNILQISSLQNGTANLIYLQNQPYPYGYYFTRNILGGKAATDSSTIIIGTYNLPVYNNYTTNTIQLKTGVVDTLKAHVIGVVYDSIWYNGILKKDTMTIVK